MVEGIPGHGCFGQFKAATPSVGVSGQLYSTDNTEVASNVTPFLNRMLLMNGVIGKYVASKDTTARQPTATRAHWLGGVGCAVGLDLVEVDRDAWVVELDDRRRVLRLLDDAGLVLVDDRDTGALAGSVGQGVVGEDRSTKVEDPDEQEQEERDDQREFDEGLASAALACCGG